MTLPSPPIPATASATGGPALPRVAAHLGVLDEAALIVPCIAHLRAIGVSHLIVHDMGSNDGTRDRLAAQAGHDLRVLHSHADMPYDTLMAQVEGAVAMAGTDWGADWVLMLDADEFPLPAGGDIRPVLARAGAAGADLVEMPRYNVVLGPDGPALPLPPAGVADHARILLYARALPDFRRRLERDPTLGWLRAVPLPKIALRPGRTGALADGGHDAAPASPGAPLTRLRSDAVVIAHLALSDWPRFARKVANIRDMFARHDGRLPATFGWHWKRWAALDAAGMLRHEYDRSALDAAALAELRARGDVQSVAELLAPASASVSAAPTGGGG